MVPDALSSLWLNKLNLMTFVIVSALGDCSWPEAWREGHSGDWGKQEGIHQVCVYVVSVCVVSVCVCMLWMSVCVCVCVCVYVICVYVSEYVWL